MSKEEKGLSFVPQINDAYEAVVKAEGSSLESKIKLGELLNLAKKAVGHGPWTAWLEKHCPKISHRSANVYMKLADPDNKRKLTEKSNSQRAAILTGSEMSIRTALNELRTPEEKQKAKERAARMQAAKSAKPPSVSPVIKEKLQDLDVDDVFNLLVKTFDQDFLDTLEERLSEHLAPIEAEKKDDLSIPPSLRRELQ
jgi:hypothetical protein